MFDPTKPVQTRNGRKARILCADAMRFTGEKYIVALIQRNKGEEVVTYKLSGIHHEGWVEYDLINIPEKHVRYVISYMVDNGIMYTVNKKEPEGEDECYACKRVEIEIGQYDK